MEKSYTVWLWFDDSGDVRHVGYGQFLRGVAHPARIRWEESRTNESDSPLDLWLCDYPICEPRRETFGPTVMSESEAVGLCAGLRARHKETVLKTRGLNSYAGGHPKRGVYRFSEDLNKCAAYESVRDAARSVDVNASTVTRWCQDDTNPEWGYLTD